MSCLAIREEFKGAHVKRIAENKHALREAKEDIRACYVMWTVKICTLSLETIK
jgi:hypothetical protein